MAHTIAIGGCTTTCTTTTKRCLVMSCPSPFAVPRGRPQRHTGGQGEGGLRRHGRRIREGWALHRRCHTRQIQASHHLLEWVDIKHVIPQMYGQLGNRILFRSRHRSIHHSVSRYSYPIGSQGSQNVTLALILINLLSFEFIIYSLKYEFLCRFADTMV